MRLKDAVGRWKTDIILAGQYLNPLMLFMALASLLYDSNIGRVKQWIPSYWQFLILAFFTFPFVFKISAKLILKLGWYKSERQYQSLIDPLQVDMLTPKERIYYVPLTATTIQLQIDSLKAIMTALDLIIEAQTDTSKRLVYEKTRKQTLKTIVDMEKKLSKYNELLGAK